MVPRNVVHVPSRFQPTHTHRLYSKKWGAARTAPLPFQDRFARLRAGAKALGLSREARKRLEWMLWYDEHGRNARATCRHFGIAPKVFYTWRKRFDERHLELLEDRSRRPKHLRHSTTTPEQAERIYDLRQRHIRYSKLKIAILYERRYGERISSWKVQQVIESHQLYPNPKRAENTAKKRRLAWKKKRVTDLVKEPRPGFAVGIDTIVLWIHGQKRYVLTAVDAYSRVAFARMYTSNSSLSAADFLRRLRLLLGQDFVHVHTDNGCEFHKYFESAVHELNLTHWWSRVKTPKDNAKVERFNRTLREEFIDRGNLFVQPPQFNMRLTEWLVEYNFHRPHAALGYRCPIQLLENMSRVLPMYPSCTFGCAYLLARLMLRLSLRPGPTETCPKSSSAPTAGASASRCG